MANQRKRFIWVIIILVIVFGGLVGYNVIKNHFIAQYFAHYQKPPVTTSSAKSELKTIQPKITTVGSIVAVDGVDVSSQVAGIVKAVHFNSGQSVQKGQELVVLDDSVEQQALKNFQAQLQLDIANFRRSQKLYKQHAVSKQGLEQSQSALKQTQANVQKTEAQINQMHIKAPFSGRIGIKQIQLGQYLSPGQVIASLQDPSRLHVNFSLPEKDLAKLKTGLKVLVDSDSAPNKQVAGVINALNSTVDPDTRNIQVQALVNNRHGYLYPGAYAKVTVLAGTPKQEIVVPETAVTYTLFGDTVYVLKPTGKKDKNGQAIYKASEAYVTVGQQLPDHQVVIEKGLKAGELVSTAGQLKLYDGAEAVINNSVKLDKINPKNKYI